MFHKYMDPPRVSECKARCLKFAEITGTDKDLAIFYLQDADWDLYRSLLAFYRERKKKPFFLFDSKSKPDENCSSEGIAEILESHNVKHIQARPYKNNNNNDDDDKTSSWFDFTEDSKPDTIRLLSWNLDGRHSEYLSERVQGVCDTIRIKEPHVVFLQEVVYPAQKILEEKCPSYDLVKSGYRGNYLAILLRRGVATFENVEVTDFLNSSQHRKLLNVKCTIKGIKFDILNTHLENTKRKSQERKRQLMLLFDRVDLADIDRTVIFGGDLCIRDNEIAEIDGVPEDADDIWEVTGMRPEAKFTWDTLYNDNLEYDNSEFRFASDARFRFDRLYIRHCKPKATVQPVDFELVGLERLPSCQKFPSDHWGLLIHFNLPI
ncbi:hypothetical protein ACJMK2_003853 [Sinanodonta woodiana]|uniref:Endonuclease/exonuclease/phosphatase domain-containing protein n=1 Tax=Sinanodonta woodiana TaxID=1069815 RepID=A0ABD3Y021_SINWO